MSVCTSPLLSYLNAFYKPQEAVPFCGAVFKNEMCLTTAIFILQRFGLLNPVSAKVCTSLQYTCHAFRCAEILFFQAFEDIIIKEITCTENIVSHKHSSLNDHNLNH